MSFTFLRPLVAGAVAALCLAATTHDAHAEERNAAVTIETGDPHLEVFDRTNDVVELPVGRYGVLAREYVFANLCTSTPCDANLAPGVHRLGLSKPGGRVVEAGPIRLGEGPVTLKGEYKDNTTLRVAGILTVLGSVGVGAALIAISYDKTPHTVCYGEADLCSHGYQSDMPVLVTGISIATVGTLVGTALAFLPDTARFQVVPFTMGAAPGRREAGMGAAVPNGLALTMRF